MEGDGRTGRSVGVCVEGCVGEWRCMEGCEGAWRGVEGYGGGLATV